MTRFRIFAALLAALLTPFVVAATATDWTRTVTESPVGGHVLGNPQARDKLVEYASYTCSHCAHFEVEGVPRLKSDYLKPGNLSFELRNFVRDPVDLAMALMARCGSSDQFFENHATFMRAQKDILARVRAQPRSITAAWYTGAYDARLKKVASDVDLYSVMRPRGFTDAQLDSCLTDTNARDKVVAMTDHARTTLRIPGTPSFTLNGALVPDAADWKSLEPRLPTR